MKELRENFREWKIGSRLRKKELETLMMFTIRFFNWSNSMYRVDHNTAYDYYDLYWNMTQRQYTTLCEAYKEQITGGN